MRPRGIVTLFGRVTGAAALAAAVTAENPAPTLKTDVQPIFDMACADCHGARRRRRS